MFRTNFVEKIKTHIYIQYFFFENPAVYGITEKYGTAGQSTDVNMAHALCMLGN